MKKKGYNPEDYSDDKPKDKTEAQIEIIKKSKSIENYYEESDDWEVPSDLGQDPNESKVILDQDIIQVIQRYSPDVSFD